MKPGQLLCDRYRIEKALDPGGFGETFVAIDTHLPSNPQVVVKLLKPIDPSPATLQIAQRLFKQEAEILERLGKDNDRIPSLYAYFELESEFYLVQEYIKGNTLKDELHGQLSESDTLDILKEILTGLKTVHPAVIHRDLKPANIIRRGIDQKLVLIDFGAVKQVRIATVTTPNPVISRTISIGTNGYTPNEQWSGAPKLASDIYAVGAIAIQCLTGSAPDLLFDEDSLKLEWQHLRQVNRDLVQVLNKMVAPDYRQRYANAAEALQVIESLISPSAPPQIQPSIPVPIPIPIPVLVPISPPIPIPIIVPAPAQPIPVAQPPLQTPANQRVPKSPTKQVQQPVNRGVKTPAPNKIQSPVKKQVKTPSKGINRRNFFKWLGFGGVGAVSVLALSQIGKKSSEVLVPTRIDLEETNSSPSVPATPTNLKETNSPPSVPATQVDNTPKLTRIKFTSVKLNGKGVIIAKPAGSAQIYTEALGNGVDLKMVKIPGGKFMMGSPDSEKDREANESPQHQVTVSEFYLGQTLVTQSQYQAIMGNNPSYFKGNNKFPVEQVSWLDAIEFCEKLSQKTNRTYRLPSEAEWEYACRAGSTTPYAFGETINRSVVNYFPNYAYAGAARLGYNGYNITPVASFPPNLFGLYDMHGNLDEWCLDEPTDNYNGVPTDGSARGNTISQNKNNRCLVRGGSYDAFVEDCRSANRRYHSYIVASTSGKTFGFRVVCQQSRTS
jgi:eukaryotic-like serine/threonine-protein kinase